MSCSFRTFRKKISLRGSEIKAAKVEFFLCFKSSSVHCFGKDTSTSYFNTTPDTLITYITVNDHFSRGPSKKPYVWTQPRRTKPTAVKADVWSRLSPTILWTKKKIRCGLLVLICWCTRSRPFSPTAKCVLPIAISRPFQAS